MSATVLSADSARVDVSIVEDQASAVHVGESVNPPISTLTSSPFSEHVPLKV